MAYVNVQNNQGFRSYPTVILSSYSDINSRDFYFSIDIWNNRLSFTFGDNSSKETPISISVLMSVDKSEYLNYLIRDIYKKRIDAYLKNEPYQNIPEEQAYTIDCVASYNSRDKRSSQEANQYKIKIFTTSVDGIPRLTFKLVNDNNTITVILGSKNVETACIDPNNIVRLLDKTDTVVARLSKDLNDITNNLTIYKMFSGFFDFFIGPKYKGVKNNRSNTQKYDESFVKTGNYESNATPDDITM